MNEEDYRHFSIGLRKAIAASDYRSEQDFARGLMHKTTLSRDLSLNTSARMSATNRQRCAERLGVEIDDIVGLGRSVDGGLDPPGPGWHGDFPGDAGARPAMTEQEIYFWKLYRLYGTEQMLDDWIMELLTFAPDE